jgi:hypothetical protein
MVCNLLFKEISMRISTPRLLSASLVGVLLGFFSLTAAAQTNVGSVNIGSSATTTVTVTLPSGGTLGTISVVTQGEPNLDFTDAGGGSCAVGTLYAANATCTVNVAFQPKYAGARYGAVVLANSTGVLATTYLQGTGLGPQATFFPGTQSTLKLGPNGSTEASSVIADGNGNLYVLSQSAQILKETPSSGGYIESAVAVTGSSFAWFAIDGAGNLFYNFQDTTSNSYGPEISTIKKATLNAGIYTTSTVYTSSQPVDDYISLIAVDGSGDVFIIDPDTNLLKETPSNGAYSQRTIYSDLSNTYDEPAGIVVDGNSNIFILFDNPSFGDKSVLEISPSSTGYIYNFVGTNIPYPPGSIAVDGMGNLYISNAGQTIKETYSNGSYVQSMIAEEGTTVDGAGNLYFSDGLYIKKLDNADPPSFSFLPTIKGTTSTDSPQIVTATNLGNAALNISAVSFPVDFPEAPGATGDCASGASLSTGESCTLTIDFSPIAALGSTPNDLSEAVAITTNTLNSTAKQQNVTVAGIESLTQLTAPAPVFSLPSGNATSENFNINIADAAQNATINYTLSWISSTGTITSSPGVDSDQSPITINFNNGINSVLNAVTVNATAIAPGYLTSPVSTVTYTYTDFNISVTPDSISGASGTATITITPLNSNGFPFPVTFSCSAPPAQGSSCSFSPATVTPGNGAASTTMTVRPASTSSELHRNSSPLFPGSVLAVTLCCFGWRKRRRLRALLLITVSIAGLSLINGCGAACLLCGQQTDTTPATYTLSVYATSGSVSHTAYFSYVVNFPTE